MTIEGKEAALSVIDTAYVGLADKYYGGSGYAFLKAVEIMSNVVRALEEGATIEDLRKFTEPAFKQAIDRRYLAGLGHD